MGSPQFEKSRGKIGKASQFSEETFNQAATYDIFYYQYNGTVTLHQDAGVELSLTIPPGNYEIEAFAPIYNNSDQRHYYFGDLEFFLGNEARLISEDGQIGSTVEGRPHNLRLSVMACFTQSKVIKFKLGSSAPSMVFTSRPSVTVRRVGAIRYAFD